MLVAISALVLAQPRVVTSNELLRNRAVPGKEREIGKHHRWMLFGDWNEKAVDSLRDGAFTLVHWRASLESDNQMKEAMVGHWKSHLGHPAVPILPNLVRDIIAEIPADKFPPPSSPSGKWFKFDANSSADLKGESAAAAKRAIQFAVQKWKDPNIRGYLLLRKICGSLTGYAEIVDGGGNEIELDTVKMPDADLKPTSALAKLIFPDANVTEIPIASNEEVKVEGTKAKDFELNQVIADGFTPWFQAKVAPAVGWSRRPVAVLADEMAMLDFVKSGGSYSGYLRSHGYNAVQVGDVDLVIPDSLVDVEKIHVNEQEVAQIDGSKSAGEIIQTYAKWVDNSGLMGSFDRLSYLEGALCWQRNLPLLSENIYPLVPVLARVGRIDTRQPMLFRLPGTSASDLGNRIIFERIGDPFVLGPQLPSEMRTGYAWGPNGTEQLTALSITSHTEQQVFFKSLMGTAKNPWDLAEQLRAYGTTWDRISLSAANKPAELHEGELVTISFQCASRRILSGDMFFPRRQIFKGQFVDLPKELMDKIRESSNAINQGMDDDKTSPPPPY